MRTAGPAPAAERPLATAVVPDPSASGDAACPGRGILARMENHDDGRSPRQTASPLVLGTMGWGASGAGSEGAGDGGAGGRGRAMSGDEGGRTAGDGASREAAVLDAALALGVAVLDTADIYGDGASERAVGAALAGLDPAVRAGLRVQTKCGIVLPGTTPPGAAAPAPTTRYDSSPAHLRASLTASLERLGTAKVDTLLIHRPDLLTSVEDTVRAFLDEREAGRVDRLGVSNLPLDRARRFQDTLRRLSADGTGLDCVQLELGLHHRALVEAAVLANHDTAAATSGAAGLPRWCADEGIILQAWGPLGQGRYTGAAAGASHGASEGAPRGAGEGAPNGASEGAPQGDPQATVRSPEQEAAVVVQELAERLGVPGEAVVLGWLRRLPWDVRPVVGTMDPGRLAACARAEEAARGLDHADWYRLLTAARGVPLP